MFVEDLLIESFDELGSTQAYAKELVLSGRIGNNIVISTLNQTNGKGRYDRDWISRKGNIAITIILEATENDHQVSYLTGLAVRDTITALCPTLSPKLKWVNDTLVDHQKICGILLEKVGQTLLVGIGVNLVDDESLEKIDATSLTNLGHETSHSLFLDILLENFKKYYNSWQQHGFTSIKNIWKENAYKLGEQLKVNFPDGSSELGIMQDIDNNGNLLLSINGKIRQIQVAELFIL
jgi:BirA family transcriptional regulator, biotin operon repressor / biotin---[acetyl-CoA-carboxylase] ligase